MRRSAVVAEFVGALPHARRVGGRATRAARPATGHSAARRSRCSGRRRCSWSARLLNSPPLHLQLVRRIAVHGHQTAGEQPPRRTAHERPARAPGAHARIAGLAGRRPASKTASRKPTATPERDQRRRARVPRLRCRRSAPRRSHRRTRDRASAATGAAPASRSDAQQRQPHAPHPFGTQREHHHARRSPARAAPRGTA